MYERMNEGETLSFLVRPLVNVVLLFLLVTLSDTLTYTNGRTCLGERSACRRDLYLTTHNNHTRQISMPPAGFEPTVPEIPPAESQ